MTDSWLTLLGPKAQRDELNALRSEFPLKLADARWAPMREAIASVSDLRTTHFDASGPQVQIGLPTELNPEQSSRLQASLLALRPWKKGPFSLFGIDIDAEWRSDLKWERLAPWVGSLNDQMVVDIGCHNAYFMYRMLAHGARTVIGFEPHAALAHVFNMLQGFHPRPELNFELLGVEHVHLLEGSLDTIFCLGILYHHTDPVGLLRKLRASLNSGGRVFIDCQGIPGGEALSLTPAGRYAGASGIWFLPTLPALTHWAKRAGFSRVETIFSEPLSTGEQRSTAWAPINSLAEFLDPADPSRTIEGYPAPWRHYILLRP